MWVRCRPAGFRLRALRLAWIESTLVVVASDSRGIDRFIWSPRSDSDTSLLLGTAPLQPLAAVLEPPEEPVVLVGETEERLEPGKRSVIRLTGARRSLFALRAAHAPFALFNLYLQTYASEEAEPDAMALIPFVFYIHEVDLASPFGGQMSRFADVVAEALSKVSRTVGEFYSHLHYVDTLQEHIRVSKERSVLVLGSYAEPHMTELRQVQASLHALAYDGLVLSDLIEIPVQSVEEKLRMWAAVARFSVMIDRQPGGHLSEYLCLREQRTVLGICRTSPPSTYMIGDDNLVDINHFKVFPIERGESAAGLVPDVARWAEDHLAHRASAYAGAYPWRQLQ
jgi:hypothetical protein